MYVEIDDLWWEVVATFELCGVAMITVRLGIKQMDLIAACYEIIVLN